MDLLFPLPVLKGKYHIVIYPLFERPAVSKSQPSSGWFISKFLRSWVWFNSPTNYSTILPYHVDVNYSAILIISLLHYYKWRKLPFSSSRVIYAGSIVITFWHTVSLQMAELVWSHKQSGNKKLNDLVSSIKRYWI